MKSCTKTLDSLQTTLEYIRKLCQNISKGKSIDLSSTKIEPISDTMRQPITTNSTEVGVLISILDDEVLISVQYGEDGTIVQYTIYNTVEHGNPSRMV